MAKPTTAELVHYLGNQVGIQPSDADLTDALTAAEARVVARCCPFDDENARPEEVDRAIIMQAARLYRRRFSINGVEGFGDLGLYRVPNLDSDIEDLLIRYLRYDFA